MNLFNLIKEQVVGKKLTVFTNPTEIPWRIKNPNRYDKVNTEYCKEISDEPSNIYTVSCKREAETFFELYKTKNCYKEISVTILNITIDSWGDYEEHDIYLCFHFEYNNNLWKVSERLENIDEIDFSIK